MAAKKMGRPTNNPRNKALQLRLAENELDKIQYCADMLETSRTNAVMKGIELLLEDLEKEK